MINFTFLKKITVSPRKRYKDWVSEIINTKGYKIGNIHYIFVDDDYLLDLNQKYLNHDWYTDIITFDYSEGDTLSGDIFISVDRVTENAKEYKVKREEELLRVMAHGILHLCGLNDESEEEKLEMKKNEDRAIERFINFKKITKRK
jgi:rRNA maturation RNase YbeY